MSTKILRHRSVSPRLTGLALALVTVLSAATAYAQGAYPGYASGHSHVGSWPSSCTGPVFMVSPSMATHEFHLNVVGSVRPSEITSQQAPGYVSHQSTCLEVSEAMRLEIEVTSSNVDNVLVLMGPSGVFSDDDSGDGTNARIERRLLPGRYQLFAGTFHHGLSGVLSVSINDTGGRGRRGAGHSDRIEPGVVHVPSPTHVAGPPGRGRGAHASDPEPSIGACPAGADVLELRRRGTRWSRGVASGEVDSSERMGHFEAGWLPSTAQICVVVHRQGHFNFEVTSSSADTVMALVPTDHSKESYFDDDGGSGLLSHISGRLDPGTYLLYVGTYGYGDHADYQLFAQRGRR